MTNPSRPTPSEAVGKYVAYTLLVALAAASTALAIKAVLWLFGALS